MKFIRENPPTEPTYLFELTHEEITALNTLLPDLVDRTRGVLVDYTVDGTRVEPSLRALAAFKNIVSALAPYNTDDGDHDYFDWWTEVENREL